MTEEAPAVVADNAEAAPPIAEAVTQAPVTDTPASTTTSEVPEWRASLPADIRDDPSITKFDTIEGLAKSYKNAQVLIGADKVPIPKAEEDWDRWYKAAGRPDDPAGYEFKAPETIPEGMVYNAELDNRLAGISHKTGLNKRQADTLRTELLEIVKEGGMEQLQASEAARVANEQSMAEATRALKAEWGNAYDQKAMIAGRAINQLLPPEAAAKLEAAGLGNDPDVVKAFHGMGVKLIGEKQLIGEGTIEQAPADLDAAIKSHRQKYMGELTDRSHPDHNTRVAELTALTNRRFS